MGVRCLKAKNQVTELQLRLLVEGGHRIHDNDLRTFITEKHKNQFLKIEEILNTFYNLYEKTQIPDYSSEQVAGLQ